ncbi:MAG: DNA repair protein RecO [Bdellovibrionaceae bacterium]|nr:DNA repair protein RecO [Bdellovibrio sp.]
MREKQDRFIILKKIKYGEADLIIHALGSNGSKSSFMARSALKSKKRFGGGILEPIHYVTLTYRDSAESGKMKTLNEAILIDDFKSIRSDYDKLELALFVVNCVSHVSQEGDANSDFLFNLTGHALRAVSVTENISLLKLHFCLKFLYQQGVISIEPWMAPFLKKNITENIQLLETENIMQSVEQYLDSIESLILKYIKTADTGFS